MNARNIGYWISTALFALACLGGGVMDLRHAPEVQQVVQTLGYPDYLMTILGMWKLLGIAAILSPALPRLKEWAYAGFFFDLSGAVASHLMSGDAASHALPPLIIAVLALASWALRPSSRKLVRDASADSAVVRTVIQPATGTHIPA
jgi:uncharacterized membrane protein YphA (DoxX/SURF4 family)